MFMRGKNKRSKLKNEPKPKKPKEKWQRKKGSHRKNVEEKLKTSETQFLDFARSVPVQISISRVSDGIILFTNLEYNRAFGYVEADLIGKKAPDLYYDPADRIKLMKTLKQQGFVKDYEVQVKRVDGTTFWVSASIQPFVFNGQPAYFGISVDITERKRAVEMLQKARNELETIVLERTNDLRKANKSLDSEIKRFNDVLETLPAYLVLLTPDYHVPFANKFFRERFGESHGRRCYEYLFKRDTPCENCKTYDALKNNAPLEWEWLGPDEHNYYIYDFPFTDTDGSPLIMEMGIDITKQKQAEEALREAHDELERRVEERTKELKESEEKFKSLYTSMNEGVCLHEIIYNKKGKQVDYKILDINPMYEKITNLTKNDVIGKLASEVYHTGKPPYIDIYAQVAFTGKPESFETYFPPMKKHFNISVFSPGKGKFATVFSDITERKQTEEALLRAKTEWEQTFDSVPDLIAILDKSHKIIRANKAMAQRLGIPVDQCVNLNCYRCVHGETKPPKNCPHTLTLNDGKEHIAEVYEENLGGYFLVSTTPIFDSNGTMLGAVHVARDITDRKQAEEALRDSESRLQRAQEISHLGSWELDLINNHLIWSDEVYRIFGLKPQEFKATYEAFLQSVHPDDRAVVDDAYSESLREGRNSYEIEHRIIRKNGEVRFVHEKCEHIKDDSGKIIRSIGMVHDITERKQMESELQRIEWLLTKRTKSKSQHKEHYKITQTQPYGDLTLLNHSRLIRDSLGPDLLTDIVNDYLDLLDSSAAIYEKNGDYAMGIFSSGWCKFMDLASRHLCNTDDNYKALNSGKWLCHESCWTKASENSIKTGRPADTKCEGGIHIYAVPIQAGKEIVGSINFGYGDPPHSANELNELAAKYKVNIDELRRHAEAYQTRPPYIIELAKARLEASARLIGEIIKRKQTETELARLASFPLKNPNPIVEIDFSGKLQYQNPASEKIFPDLRKKGFHHGFLSGIKNLIPDFQKKRRSQIVREIKINDAYFLQTISYIPENQRIRIYSTDITKRKQMEEDLQASEEKYRGIVENTTNVIMVTQPDGIISYLSPLCTEVTGYSPEELIGTNPIIFHPDDIQKVQQALSRALKGDRGSDFEYRILTKQGETKWISHSWSPIFLDKKLQSIVSVITDITERKTTEEKIKRLNENLLHHSIELAAANKELEAFSYSVSHDLRAPLRSIDGFSQALLEDYSNSLDEQGKDYIQRVRNATQRMGQLIDDMLRLSRLTRAELHHEKIDFTSMGKEVIKKLSITEPSRKIKEIIQPGMITKGDKKLLEILLENLLGNAWKFTRNNEHPKIEFGQINNENESVYFIRDNGAGFDMAYVDKLFIPFQRLHSADEFPGTGIGLAIASRIIHRHGGRIWAESQVGKGATFYFTLQTEEMN
jgi:PAS domain S-box-containing protein